MSGIDNILRSIENENVAASTIREKSKLIFLKDGDQLFCTPVATGKDDDKLLDQYYMYAFPTNTSFTYVLAGMKGENGLIADDRIDISNVPKVAKRQLKFALWVYVHNILHTQKAQDYWKEIEGPLGKKMFEETVNDFRIISLPLGAGKANFYSLAEIYNDWGSLDKGIVRFKRNGEGLETTYLITPTPKQEQIPSEKKSEIPSLPTIKDYLFEAYSVPPVTGNNSFSSNIEEDISSSNDDLF